MFSPRTFLAVLALVAVAASAPVDSEPAQRFFELLSNKVEKGDFNGFANYILDDFELFLPADKASWGKNIFLKVVFQSKFSLFQLDPLSLTEENGIISGKGFIQNKNERKLDITFELKKDSEYGLLMKSVHAPDSIVKVQ